MQLKILVVDDEESICEILKYNLEVDGYSVDTAFSAEEALNLDIPSYSLIILDIMMDKLSGFDFAKRLKNNLETENIPILFCSALNGEDERVMGLNIGADDYIIKPFLMREVLARVRSVLRRSGITKILEQKLSNGTLEPDIVFNSMRINNNDKRCYISGKDIELTPKEYELLYFLVSQRNSIVSREDIMHKVWGENFTNFRTIDTNVTRLRKKLGDYGANIITRLGYGYGFKENL